jgi:hypothetical protein
MKNLVSLLRKYIRVRKMARKRLFTRLRDWCEDMARFQRKPKEILKPLNKERDKEFIDRLIDLRNEVAARMTSSPS